VSLVRRLAGIAIILVSAVVVPTASAAAATYYNYWSYWHKPPGATGWQYSSVGASGYYLKQGTQVEGWRFALGTASPNDPQPRPSNVSYDAYCGGKDTGKTYRVLLVVDYGTESGAPSGPVYSCYGFDDSTTGFQVLTQQHTERDSGGLICAIDSYPKSGCGDTASSPAPSSQPSHRPTHTAAPSPIAPSSPAIRPTTSTQPATMKTHVTTSLATRPKAMHTHALVLSRPLLSTSPTPTASAYSSSLHLFRPAKKHTGFPVGLAIGGGALALLAGGAWWLRRRAR
jgi:hypothetical protein